MREGGRIVDVAAIVAVAVDAEGRWEIVGLHIGPMLWDWACPGPVALPHFAWLVPVVTRDRSTEHAPDIALGPPEATQVADRWHLLANVRQRDVPVPTAVQARTSY